MDRSGTLIAAAHFKNGFQSLNPTVELILGSDRATGPTPVTWQQSAVPTLEIFAVPSRSSVILRESLMIFVSCKRLDYVRKSSGYDR